MPKTSMPRYLLLLLTLVFGLSRIVAADKPNVILIMTDDQGWGDIHSHGNQHLATPVLDKLASDGARFDHFFVSPLCAPTRASLLSGRYHLRTGTQWVTNRLEVMRSNEVTIAEILKTAGYTTGCFGKWHNGREYPYHPNGQGFDEFFGFCGGHFNKYVNPLLERNGKPVETTGFITDLLTDELLKFVRKNKGKPFFAYVPYNAPHGPYQILQKYYDKFADLDSDEKTKLVYGMVENIDHNIGRLLELLDELDLTRSTVVIFLTDNGPNGRRFNGGMRGTKGSKYEGGQRVPCFVRWPGKIDAGKVIRPIAAHIDLLPTIAEMCGVNSPKTLPLDGISLARILQGTEVADSAPPRILFDTDTVRTQTFRFMVKNRELYDLTKDPGQKTDIANQHLEVVQRLIASYQEWHKDVIRGTENTPGPIPVGHPKARYASLPASDATPTAGLAYNRGKGWAHTWLQDWTDTNQSATWKLNVLETHEYRIQIEYTCPDNDVGSEVEVEVAGIKRRTRLMEGYDPPIVLTNDGYAGESNPDKSWKLLDVGTAVIAKGKHELTVRVNKIPGKIAFELNGVRLQRVKTDSSIRFRAP